MTFATPLALLALAGVPVLVYVYLARRRQQARVRTAFASPLLAASHTPRPEGARRHLPFALYGLALVALLLALAKPQHSVAVPVERASIMLMTDVSGSMLAKDVTPDRLTAARRAQEVFVTEIPSRVNIGVMAFNQQASVLQSPTRDRAAVRDALDRLESSGGTATGTAVATATQILRPGGTNTDSRPPAAIVLLSDGASTRGVDPVKAAAAAKKSGIRVYTVALGTADGTIEVPRKNGTTQTKPVPPDPDTLKEMADLGGGAFFASASADRLSEVYKRLGSELGTRQEQREITPAFAAGAALLLLSGAGLSLRWFGRLV
jgi:Ca-activated chloride channel family protein